MGALFTALVKGIRQSFVNADGTTKKDLITGNDVGTRVEAVWAATDETAGREIQLWLFDGTNTNLLGSVAVPIGAGNTAAVPAVNLLDRSKLTGLAEDGTLLLEANWKLQASMNGAVTAAKTVYVSGWGGHLG